MINSEILNHLSPITKEEQRFLEGSKDIDRTFYMTACDNIIRQDKFLSSGLPIAMRPHARFVHFPEHRHDYIEFVYMCSGHTTHILNGRTLMLSEGDILIIGKGVTQEILPAGKNDIAVNFIIRSDFFEEILSTFSLKIQLTNEYIHFSVPDILPVHNLAENLLWLLMQQELFSVKQCRFTIGLMLMTLTKNHDSGIALERVMKYIEENYKDGSLSCLANSIHYDFSWLSREIKNRTGKTYTDLVQEKRLAEACFLLRNTDMNVSDISINVGYNNISYFHRLFNKYFGMSPHKYRSLP